MLTPSKCTNWFRFCAKSLLHEVAQGHANDVCVLRRRVQSDVPDQHERQSSDRQRDLRARKLSPLQCFHKLFLQEARAADPLAKVNCASLEFWTQVKRRWSQLDATSTQWQLAHRMSEASEADAKLRRMRAKHGGYPPERAVVDSHEDAVLTIASPSEFAPPSDPLTAAQSLCLSGDWEMVPSPLTPETVRGIVESAWPISVQHSKVADGERYSVKRHTAHVREVFRYLARGQGVFAIKLMRYKREQTHESA